MKTKQKIIATMCVETSEDVFVAHYSASGLARLDFPGTKKVKEPPTAPAAVHRWHKLTSRAVSRVLQGRPAGQIPPLDLTGATAFQQKVWDALRQVQTGDTETYAQIAVTLGRPKSARAVGNACGANPVPLLIPCHRIVATGGGMGGFSGGLHWKRKLLAMENYEGKL